MKLKDLLNEKIVNKVNLDDYAPEFQNTMYKKYKGKDILGWQLSIDDSTGEFYWDKKNSKVNVIATPFWNGEEELPVNVQNIQTGDTVSQKKYPLRHSGDPRKDEREFVTILYKVFKSIK